jgi:hypothetical protein
MSLPDLGITLNLPSFSFSLPLPLPSLPIPALPVLPAFFCPLD